MDEASLLAAVRQLKLEHATSSKPHTAKEIFAALTAAGKEVELTAVKKACRTVTKALENEPTASGPSEAKLPPLVSPPTGSVAFLRCLTCQVRVPHKAKVCGGCYGVCYCSPTCQRADASHAVECDACKRHMATDVRVTLPGAGWLEAAMGHRCELSSCELYESVGAHEADAYRLLCGCVLPPAQHRYLVASIPAPDAEAEIAGDAAVTATEVAVPRSWGDYYEGRAAQLPSTSPLVPQHGRNAPARSSPSRQPPTFQGSARLGELTATLWAREERHCRHSGACPNVADATALESSRRCC